MQQFANLLMSCFDTLAGHYEAMTGREARKDGYILFLAMFVAIAFVPLIIAMRYIHDGHFFFASFMVACGLPAISLVRNIWMNRSRMLNEYQIIAMRETDINAYRIMILFVMPWFFMLVSGVLSVMFALLFAGYMFMISSPRTPDTRHDFSFSGA